MKHDGTRMTRIGRMLADFIFSFLLGFLCFRSLAANCFPIVSSLSYFLVKSLFYFFIRPDSYRDPLHRVRLLTDPRHPCSILERGVFGTLIRQWPDTVTRIFLIVKCTILLYVSAVGYILQLPKLEQCAWGSFLYSL